MVAEAPSALRPLTVSADPEYVIGFPVHVALGFTAERPVDRLPRPSPWRTLGAIGLSLRPMDPDAAPLAAPPRPPVGGGAAVPRFSLAPGATRRLLVDLAPMTAGVEPGAYSAIVRYEGGRDPLRMSESAALTLRFRAPNDNEVALRAALARSLDAHGSWGAWTMNAGAGPADRAPYALHPDDPLRFNRVLRWCVHGDAARALDPSLLAALTGVYEPERYLLAAELHRVRGDAEALERTAREARARFGGLEAQLSEIAAAATPLAWHLDRGGIP